MVERPVVRVPAENMVDLVDRIQDGVSGRVLVHAHVDAPPVLLVGPDFVRMLDGLPGFVKKSEALFKILIKCRNYFRQFGKDQSK